MTKPDVGFGVVGTKTAMTSRWPAPDSPGSGAASAPLRSAMRCRTRCCTSPSSPAIWNAML